jgi:integrase/recombinase XerD
MQTNQAQNYDYKEDNIYNQLSPRVQKRLKNLLQEDFVSEENKEAVKEFIYRITSVRDDQLSDHRLFKYISQFGQILPHVDYPLMDAGIKEIRLTLNEVDSEDISPTTQRDRRVCLNKFYRTMFFDEAERPTRVWRILKSDITSTSHPKQADLKKQYDFILPDEVMAMSEAANNRRDALMPLFFYLTGARLKTIKNVTISDLTRSETHYEVALGNKKNKSLVPYREIYPTRLTHLIREWLEVHPRSDDPDAHLFCTLQHGYNPKTGEQKKQKGDEMSRKSISNVLERLAQETELEKASNPHAYRYSMATFFRHFAEDLDIADVAEKGGWGSIEQVRDYILDPDEVENKRRKEAQGIETNIDERLKVLDKRSCGNCGITNPPTRDICGNCGHALSNKVAQKHAEREVVMVETNEKGLQGEGGKI